MKKLKRKLDKLFDEIIPTKTVFAWDFKSDHIVCNPKARKKKSKRKLAEEILKGHEAAVVVVFDKLLDGPMQINEGDILIDEVLILRRTDKDIRKRMTDAFKKGCDYAYVMTISNEQADEMISLNEFLRLSEGLPIDLGWLAEKYKLEKAALVKRHFSMPVYRKCSSSPTMICRNCFWMWAIKPSWMRLMRKRSMSLLKSWTSSFKSRKKNWKRSRLNS